MEPQGAMSSFGGVRSILCQCARLCSSFATAKLRNNGGGGVFGVLIMMVAEVAVVLVRLLMLVVGSVSC